jgi:hypothetical protein
MKRAAIGFLALGAASAFFSSAAVSQTTTTTQSLMLVSHPAAKGSPCGGSGSGFYEFHQILGNGQTGAPKSFSTSNTFVVTDIEWNGVSSYSGTVFGPVELQLLSPGAVAASSGESPFASFNGSPRQDGWAAGGAHALQNLYVQSSVLCARVIAMGQNATKSSSYTIYIQGYVLSGSSG